MNRSRTITNAHLPYNDSYSMIQVTLQKHPSKSSTPDKKYAVSWSYRLPTAGDCMRFLASYARTPLPVRDLTRFTGSLRMHRRSYRVQLRAGVVYGLLTQVPPAVVSVFHRRLLKRSSPVQSRNFLICHCKNKNNDNNTTTTTATTTTTTATTTTTNCQRSQRQA